MAGAGAGTRVYCPAPACGTAHLLRAVVVRELDARMGHAPEVRLGLLGAGLARHLFALARAAGEMGRVTWPLPRTALVCVWQRRRGRLLTSGSVARK